jgi:hypothetical protein
MLQEKIGPAARGEAGVQLGCEPGFHSKTDRESQRKDSFRNHREAALALLNTDARLTRKAGSFCGQLAVDRTPMSDAQRDWLDTLLERAGLPPLTEDADA